MTLAVEMNDIVKTYPTTGVLANNRVNLALRKGEILALAGENGAGKTTLMKVLCGLEPLDSGTIAIMGRPVKINSPQSAHRLALGMVHQHVMLIDEFSVAQNVTLGKEVTHYGFKIDHKRGKALVDALIEKHRFPLKGSQKVGELTPGQKQQVEILKMLYRNVRILILDEPTALLAQQEIEALFQTMRTLVADGVSLILITHKLPEIKQISDRVTIMRQAEIVGTYETAGISEEEISRLMVGRTLSLTLEKGRAWPIREEILKLEAVSLLKKGETRPLLNKVSFSAFRGEILAFAAVAGNGLGELEAILSGELTPSGGEIYYKGKPITHYDTHRLRQAGLAYVPAERLGKGSVADSSVAYNLIVTELDEFSKWGILQKKRIENYAQTVLTAYDVKGRGKDAMGSLSGGNIQKVILAREIEHLKDYILFSEPTWGLDVDSSRFVHNKILNLRSRGSAILLMSTNLDELIALSDRVIVFYAGEIVAQLDREALQESSKEELGAYMLGLKRQEVV